MRRDPREPQSWEYLRGDLEPRRTELTDLRNDNAGDQMAQAQNIILRYLENMPAEQTVDAGSMAEDISRHWPFHGEGVDFFKAAIDDLVELGWIKMDGKQVKLDTVIRVQRRFFARKIARTCSR
jgi:hypothetical protein